MVLNMDVKGILVSGIVFVILSEVINTITAVFTMGYYTNPAYFQLWSKLMMPTSGPPTLLFYTVSIFLTLLIGVIFAWVYSLLRQSIPGKNSIKGIYYGLILFLVSGLPFATTTYLLFAVPVFLLLYWTLSSLIIYLLSGIAFYEIIK